jgi:hypothetical protein
MMTTSHIDVPGCLASPGGERTQRPPMARAEFLARLESGS